MKQLYTVYLFHIKLGVLKYLLYFLQLEHGVQAIDFLSRWLTRASHGDPMLPVSARVLNEILSHSYHRDWALLYWADNADFLFHNLGEYYDELRGFSEREFGVVLRESEYLTLSAAQQAVMPSVGRKYPYSVSLEHDAKAYFEQIKTAVSVSDLNGSLQQLSEFAGGRLTVSPTSDSFESTHFQPAWDRITNWELPSSLRFR